MFKIKTRSKTLFKDIIILIFLFNILNSLYFKVLADDVDDDIEYDFEYSLSGNDFSLVETSLLDTKLNINSRAGIIFDRDTKMVLWEKNASDKRAMASTTKIMTAIVVLENANLNDTVIISKKAAGTGGSRLKLKASDKISVNDLLYGLMLKSGNDAAVALAEHVGGSVEGFAVLMNKKKDELGLESTNFVTPHGLDNENHYTTAYDLACLTDYALNNEKFKAIVSTKSCSITVNGVIRQIGNTNELLGNIYGVDGVKTGYTGNALRCLVTSCTRDGHQLIFVVLGADTKKDRGLDTKKLIDFAFSRFERVDLNSIVEEEFNKWLNINKNRISIDKAKDVKLELEYGELKNSIIPIRKGDADKINLKITCQNYFLAPLDAGKKVGKIEVLYDDEVIDNIDIFLKNKVEKKNILDYMVQILGNLPSSLDFSV